MLVGYHTPILESTVTAGDAAGTGATVTQTLDYYQEIGIRLNVVPQISEEGFINMIIHPSITSSSSSVTATSTAGTGATATSTTTEYPIIDVREAQTQVLLNDGETIVIGGLLKDVKTKTKVGIPFLVDLPWVGKFFGRDKDNVEKVDLLIFITAKIIKESEYTPEELEKLKKRLTEGTMAGPKEKVVLPKKKN
jgi:type II secretory pathway component GspD/PulD (secretin)